MKPITTLPEMLLTIFIFLIILPLTLIEIAICCLSNQYNGIDREVR